MSEYQNHGYPLQRMNVTTIKAQLRQFGIAHHPNDSKSRIVQLLEKHYAVLREQHGRNSKVYLQPDFDIGTYQVAHMRQILSQYDVAVHASASKEEVTRIFEHNIGHLKSMNARHPPAATRPNPRRPAVPRPAAPLAHNQENEEHPLMRHTEHLLAVALACLQLGNTRTATQQLLRAVDYITEYETPDVVPEPDAATRAGDGDGRRDDWSWIDQP